MGAGLPTVERSRLYVPQPLGEIEIPVRLRVTQFKDYLACPYRFYLKHILGLETLGDMGEELAANAFGNLMHKVLERFGANAAIRDSDQPDDIAAFLDEELRIWTGVRYGDSDRLAAVEIQVEQMRARLREFAYWQADQRSQGWQIVHSETTEEDVGQASSPAADATSPSPRYSGERGRG